MDIKMNTLWERDPETNVITEFCPVPRHQEDLAVSRDGEFLFLNRFDRKTMRLRRTFGTRRSGGYLGITWKRTTVYAHRAVYEAWVGSIPSGMEIDHFDCDKKNNSLENLRLVTRSENMRNPTTRKHNLAQLGRARPLAHSVRVRRVIGIDSSGRTTSYSSVTEASNATGASRSDIARVAHGQRKHAGGLRWEYCK